MEYIHPYITPGYGSRLRAGRMPENVGVDKRLTLIGDGADVVVVVASTDRVIKVAVVM
ncbi:MAG: hypothetical protein C5S48_05535 [Candidatus Methanogaster sp.]|nr:MAG: hypothetical protein C5S48_05535 [ANME-2 cluster archaeon]